MTTRKPPSIAKDLKPGHKITLDTPDVLTVEAVQRTPIGRVYIQYRNARTGVAGTRTLPSEWPVQLAPSKKAE